MSGSRQPVVDAHFHLWDPNQHTYPWLDRDPPPHIGDLAPIRRPYLPVDYRRDVAEWDLIACVNVEAGMAQSNPLSESAWLDTVLGTFDRPAVLVANVDLSRPDAAALLDAQARVRRVRGIRMRFREPGDLTRAGVGSTAIADPIFRANFGRLRDHRLTFDLQAPSDLMPEAADLASRFPEIPMILTHAGLPLDRSSQGMRAWHRGLKQLAACPNLFCKISGLAMLDHHFTPQRLRPIIRPIVEAFGPGRCMLGSNFPVDRMFGSFDAIFSAYAEALDEATSEERWLIFAGTALAVYRVTDLSSPS
jgi:predicted TIM-barrel fold metal-dependent hydrolase